MIDKDGRRHPLRGLVGQTLVQALELQDDVDIHECALSSASRTYICGGLDSSACIIKCKRWENYYDHLNSSSKLVKAYSCTLSTFGTSSASNTCLAVVGSHCTFAWLTAQDSLGVETVGTASVYLGSQITEQ